MQKVIDQLRDCNVDVPVPLDLPDMDDIIDAEEAILLSVDPEFRLFLLTVSDVVYGSLEPATVCDKNSHTYLPEIAAVAWSLGVSRELIPFCEDRGKYYCLNEVGEVSLWENGEMVVEEPWANIWQWAEYVWLES
jgi:hypothetical protein